MGAIWVSAGYQKRETLRIELKSDLKRLPDPELTDTVMALSNTEGGELYIGVEDDGTPTEVHETHSDATQLSAFVANKTIPPAPARVASLELD